MTPILRGRFQTRLLITFAVGLPLVWLLGGLWPSASGPMASALLGSVVISVGAVAGLIWEATYHSLQQLRHDRDWPPLLSLTSGLPEGLALGFGATVIGFPVAMTAVRFAVTWGIVWIAVWLATQSLVRVVEPRWRYSGSRFTVRDLSRADGADHSASDSPSKSASHRDWARRSSANAA